MIQSKQKHIMKTKLLFFCFFLVSVSSLKAQYNYHNWPANSNYVYFGADTDGSSLNQFTDHDYSLLQDKSNGNTFLNSPRMIYFRINNKNKMVIANNGKIGLGTTSPTEKLDVKGSIRVRTLNNGIAYNKVIVADNNGKFYFRDASTISGGTGTDDQKIDVLNFTGTSLSISLEDDGEATRVVDLAGLQDGFEANTDNQDLVLSGNVLSLTNDATSVDLSGYLDNTDAQTLSLSGSVLSLTSGGDVDLSSFAALNDNQTASEVTFDNLTSGLAASNAQGAIDELAEKVYWEETALGEFTLANGKVGINTTSIPNNDIPALGKYELAVGGEIIAEEVNVLLQADWPDYVFEESYDLQSLEDTEEYLYKNKHLPNVPSAQEVKEKGLNLGQMNATLLRQIEELTLHLINQNKQIEALRGRVEELESK